MKTTLKHFFVLIISLTFFSLISYSQKTLEGYIYDEKSKKPLPYAAILIGDTGVYTTSNEDGKFELFLKNIDSLEIRYLGYETVKVSTNYFHIKRIFYLKQFTSVLDEVIVNSNGGNLPKKSSNIYDEIASNQEEKRSYKLLYELIKKYRKNKKTVNSKAYFSLTSRATVPSNSRLDTIPLEQIEAFYNGKQQLSKGIKKLELKTGRFGQNRLSPFYSLDIVSLIQDFNLFKNNGQVLPNSPGNLSLSEIKKKYYLRVQKITNHNRSVIHFQPKAIKNDLFSGKIIFREKDLVIEKVVLFIKNPKYFKLSPLVKSDSISLNKVNLAVSFNPIDLDKIQYYDLDLDFVYYTDAIKMNISSNTILYLYDYNERFIKPYYTNTIEFENDYDRLLTLPVSDKIWERNYPYPRSKKKTETTNFFKQKNQFYSYYENTFPSFSLPSFRISSVVWSNQKKLLSHEIKSRSGVNLNFSYALNSIEDQNGNSNFTVMTLFDAKSSFFKPERTPRDLECINLAFDIYELNRYRLLNKMKEPVTFKEAKMLSNKAILDARVMTTLMFEESSFGLQNEVFSFWKNKIYSELEKYDPNL